MYMPASNHLLVWVISCSSCPHVTTSLRGVYMSIECVPTARMSLVASRNASKSCDVDFVEWLSQILGKCTSLYTYVHPLFGANEVSG
jgi:hypothetical protein